MQTFTATIKDASASSVAGAIVTLDPAASTGQRTAITDQAGAFGFFALEPGNYKAHHRGVWIRGLGEAPAWRSVRATIRRYSPPYYKWPGCSLQ